MRILLTGAAGFIGSHLAESLVARGDEVVGLDNFDPYYEPALKERNIAALDRWPGFYLVRGDVRDRRSIERLLTQDGFDAIVHLAARAGVRPSIDDPEGYVDVNVRGTTVLLEAARRAGIRRFVFASSSSVYGADSTPPFSTSAGAVRPISPYAATKRAGELLCEAFASLHGMRIVSLRYFTVYGPRQRPDMAFSRFIRAVDRGEPIQRFGDGTSRRDYTYVSDAVAGTVAALDSTNAGEASHRIFNIGESSTVSLDEVLRVIEKAIGRQAVIEQAPDQPGDVPLTHADVDESRRELGYEPSVPVEEGIRRQVEWFLQSGDSASAPAARPDRRHAGGAAAVARGTKTRR